MWTYFTNMSPFSSTGSKNCSVGQIKCPDGSCEYFQSLCGKKKTRFETSQCC